MRVVVGMEDLVSSSSLKTFSHQQERAFVIVMQHIVSSVSPKSLLMVAMMQ